MQRILSSASFRGSPQLSRLLSFLVESVLSDQMHRIKQYTIAVDVFGYSEHFNPHTNTAVRVSAIRLRRALDLYYLHEGERDDIRIEIPKRAYAPVFRPNGGPTAAGYAGAQAGSPATAHHGYGVAVMPFEQPFSRRKSNLAESITASVVSGLAKIRDLDMTGPTGGYKNTGINTRDAGRQDDSRFILEGRLQIYGDILRLKVSLTDSLSGVQIWMQTYEYSQTAMKRLEMEDDMTRHIVSALADFNGVIPRLISQESRKKPPDTLGSYEAISLYKHFLASLTIESFPPAMSALQRSAEMDPDHPIVLAMLAHAYCHHFQRDSKPRAAMLENAERLIRRAIDLDPDYPFAHLTEALLRFLQGQTDRCIAKLEKTISFKTCNTYVLYACAFLYAMLGRWEKGMTLWEEATHLNPRYPSIILLVPFFYYYYQGNYEEAWTYAVKFDTGLFWDPLVRAMTAGQMGRQAEAASALQELLKMYPVIPVNRLHSMRRLFYLQEHVEPVLEGLLKAGLQLNPKG